MRLIALVSSNPRANPAALGKSSKPNAILRPRCSPFSFAWTQDSDWKSLVGERQGLLFRWLEKMTSDHAATRRTAGRCGEVVVSAAWETGRLSGQGPPAGRGIEEIGRGVAGRTDEATTRSAAACGGGTPTASAESSASLARKPASRRATPAVRPLTTSAAPSAHVGQAESRRRNSSSSCGTDPSRPP